MKRILAVGCLLLIAGSVAMASSLDGFLATHRQGNLHTALRTDPIEIIKSFGCEPDSYGREPDSYVGGLVFYNSDVDWPDLRIFTYGDPNVGTGISAVSFVWTVAESEWVRELRLQFSGALTVSEVFALLGYAAIETTRPETLEVGDRILIKMSIKIGMLGNEPYLVLEYVRGEIVSIDTSGGASLDVGGDKETFLFFMNHLDDSVYMLIVT